MDRSLEGDEVPELDNRALGPGRCHAFGARGGASVGDWVGDGVQSFSILVRHDVPLPLTFDVRLAAPANFPGGTAVQFAPVLPDTRTLFFEIDRVTVNVPELATAALAFLGGLLALGFRRRSS